MHIKTYFFQTGIVVQVTWLESSLDADDACFAWYWTFDRFFYLNVVSSILKLSIKSNIFISYTEPRHAL